jgi:predicted DCC family thiol-disulfide oxidoreductase YuxK
MDNRYIVIFDGVCNFCNGAVNFIIKRDPEGVFAFSPMQSDLAQELMDKHEIYNVGVDTFLLIKNKQCFVFSSAALEIAKDLRGFWFLFNIFSLIPSRIRDFFYKMFARHRYTLFGRQETCMVPTEELKSRFVGIQTRQDQSEKPT